MKNISIINYEREHQPSFEKLNRAWIEKFFKMEARDIDAVTKPEQVYLKPGGAILMALYDGQIAGTVALKKWDASTFELSKMAVDEEFRRKGIAEELCRSAIEKAKELGARRVILYSHHSLAPALALYEKMDFHYLEMDKVIEYERADIKMEFIIDQLNIAMKITVKRADITHANAIAFIGRRSFHDAFAHLFYNKEELHEYLDYAYSVDKIAGSIRKANNVFFLALANERPVGFVKLKKHSLNPQIDSFAQMELQKIYVLKEYHGTGAGQSLMDAALELAQNEVRPEYIWLDTHISNDRAVRFYEKNGFQVCGRHYFTIGTQMFEYHLMNQMVAIEVTA